MSLVRERGLGVLLNGYVQQGGNQVDRGTVARTWRLNSCLLVAQAQRKKLTDDALTRWPGSTGIR